jgi:DNA-binding HxlR family transcriptional regulator
MVKRISHEATSCPVARSLDAIGDWWSLLIVRDAFRGKRRFGEFQKSTGAAKNILTTRLRNLVEFGILKMVPASDGSAYQEYTLTEKGLDLFPVVTALWQWGEKHFFDSREARPVLCDRVNKEPLRKLEVLSADGRRLRPADTTLLLQSGLTGLEPLSNQEERLEVQT